MEPSSTTQELLRHFKPLDPGRVFSMDPVELQYWCTKLQCSEEQLHEAVGQVGEHVTEVRDYLASHH